MLGEGHAARDAGAARVAARQAQLQIQRCPALSLEHARDRALPATRLRRARRFRQNRIADPVGRGNALNGHDFSQALGSRHAHFVIRGPINDEGTTLDAAQQNGRARHATGEGRRRDDLELSIVEQRSPAPQSPVELHVGRTPGGEAHRRTERGVPARAHRVPVCIVVTRLRPQARGHELTVERCQPLCGER